MKKIFFPLLMLITLACCGQDEYAAGVNVRGDVKFVEMVVRDSARAREYLDKGKSNFNEKIFQDALFDLDEAIYAGAGDSAYYYRGRTEMDSGLWEGAVADFDTLLRRHPDCSIYYYYRGYVWKVLWKFKEAVADFDRAIAFDPRYAAAYFQRGMSEYNLYKFEQAKLDYGMAISLAPGNGEIYYARAMTEINLFQDNEAYADLKKAKEMGNKEADAMIKKYSK